MLSQSIDVEASEPPLLILLLLDVCLCQPTAETNAAPSIYPEAWKLPKSISNLDSYPKVLEYLHKVRGLTRETVNAYKVFL